jgi:hypothetical protein
MRKTKQNRTRFTVRRANSPRSIKSDGFGARRNHPYLRGRTKRIESVSKPPAITWFASTMFFDAAIRGAENESRLHLFRPLSSYDEYSFVMIVPGSAGYFMSPKASRRIRI